MTGFGIYFVVFYLFGLASTAFYIGRGGYTATPGVLAFSMLWSLFNLIGILVWGTGLGIL